MDAILEAKKQHLLEAIHLVRNYDKELRSLSCWWDKIALLGKINSYNVAATILDDMEETKRKFADLQQKLIHHLLLEHLKKRVQDDTSRAKVSIDILIRNLFERTADVGFLATDDDIRAFLKTPQPTDDQRQFIEQRLNEYVKKYSVYDEIIVLTPNGDVSCHLDQDNPIKSCFDPLIKATIESNNEYLESFGYSQLKENQPQSLIYSCKITETNDPGSPLLGILALCFRFTDEMNAIFDDLLQLNDPSTIILTDEQGVVIASSREKLMPIGYTLKIKKTPLITDYKGVEYLFNMAQTSGYQGFYGLGWRGMVMTPLPQLSDHSNNHPQGLDEVINSSQIFSSELKLIRKNSNVVNDDLGLVVLNGKITSARREAREFMPVLEAIKKIGSDISTIFHASINSLQNTVVSSRLNDVRFLATLAADVMDRNLYERANDCRWWALTSAFREILAKPQLSESDQVKMGEILAYINELYTVYTNLYLYDEQGEIVAVSNPEEHSIIGANLSEHIEVAAALRLNETQQYCVSPFIETPFYDGRATYIYNAAIRHPEMMSRVVGGIGIVFDSEPQFQSMLLDSLPCNETGAVIEGAFALFCQRDGTIISVANNDQLTIGESIALEKEYLSVVNGQKNSVILDFNDQHYTLGIAASKGYREYKTSGDYVNDVIAMVFVPL